LSSQISLAEIISILEQTLENVENFMKTVPTTHLDDFNAFIPIANELYFSLEIFNMFDIKWTIERTSLIGQMGRIKIITTNAYISSFSIIEHCIKKMIQINNHKDYKYYIDKWKRGEFVSFNSIIKRLKDKGVINDNEYIGWGVHRKIRNGTVHNNVIPETTFEYEINGRKIHFIKDKPLYGTLDIFIVFIDDLARLHYNLVQNFHKIYF